MRSLATGLAQAHRMQTKTHSTRRPNHQKCLTKPRCQQKVSHRPAAHTQLKRNRTRAENRNLTAARTEPPAPLDSSMNAAPDDAFPRDAPYSVASEVLCRAALGRDAADRRRKTLEQARTCLQLPVNRLANLVETVSGCSEHFVTRSVPAPCTAARHEERKLRRTSAERSRRESGSAARRQSTQTNTYTQRHKQRHGRSQQTTSARAVQHAC